MNSRGGIIVILEKTVPKAVNLEKTGNIFTKDHVSIAKAGDGQQRFEMSQLKNVSFGLKGGTGKAN